MRSQISILLVTLAASLACAEGSYRVPIPRTARAHEAGPPPHAPAHGYRHKHHAQAGEIELVFDSGLGVYVVVGWPGHYYNDGHYYREADGVWHVSSRLDAGWAALSAKKLPPGLAKKSTRGKGKKRGPHPAKHGD